MKNLLIIALSLTGFLVLFSLWGFYQAVHPAKIISVITPKDFSVNYEDIAFKTEDNVIIRGWYIPAKQPTQKTIILLHGYPADKGDILPSRIFLHETYNLLFIDFRYLGQSGGKYSTVGKNEVLDLIGAIKFLQTKGINEVGIWGLSMGGAVALMTAPKVPAIKSMIIESAYARLDWLAEVYYPIPVLNYPLTKLTMLWAKLFLNYDVSEISPAVAAKDITIPVLLIYSKHDRLISIKHGLLIQEALKRNPKVEFIIVENISHGQSIPNYQKIVRNFFDASL